MALSTVTSNLSAHCHSHFSLRFCTEYLRFIVTSKPLCTVASILSCLVRFKDPTEDLISSEPLYVDCACKQGRLSDPSFPLPFSVTVTTSAWPVPSINNTGHVTDWFDSLGECLQWNVRKQQKQLGVWSTSFVALFISSCQETVIRIILLYGSFYTILLSLVRVYVLTYLLQIIIAEHGNN